MILIIALYLALCGTVIFSGLTLTEALGICTILSLLLAAWIKMQRDNARQEAKNKEFDLALLELKTMISNKMEKHECERTHQSLERILSDTSDDILGRFDDFKDTLMRVITGSVPSKKRGPFKKKSYPSVKD